MSRIAFWINDKLYEVGSTYSPDVSLNEFIRNEAGLTGTKHFCNEGGCGICIVSVKAALPPTNEMKTFSVNSCLVSVLSCNDWNITTVEGLGNKTKGYSDIQTRLARFNGTQCGYCTPGWIMHMHSLTENKRNLTNREIENSFAGNLCRCTGYRPIMDAFKTFATDVDVKLRQNLVDLEDLDFIKTCGVRCKKNCSHKNKRDNGDEKIQDDIDEDENWCILNKVENKTIVIDCGNYKYYKVFTLDEAFKAMKVGNYKVIAGNTGKGVTGNLAEPPTNVIDIFYVTELKGYIVDVNLVIGAGTTLTDMMDLFLKFSEEKQDFYYLKELYNHMDLVAHIPVRNIGTIAGNLYLKYLDKEFPSDLFLILETVGAMITIVQSNGKNKRMSLPDFLNTPMKEKLILNIILPPLSRNCFVKTFKIMPRAQNAHAVMNAGFFFEFVRSTYRIKRARIVYGNISKNFIHASRTEQALITRELYNDRTLQIALRILEQEIDADEIKGEAPAAIRKQLAIALYYKAILSLCPDDNVDPKYQSGGKTITRDTSKGSQFFDTNKNLWPLNEPIPKFEGLIQCGGEAIYANDLPTQKNEVFGAFVTADVPAGSVIEGFDMSEASKIPGVFKLYSAKDIPGQNTFTPKKLRNMVEQEEILCADKVKFFGQPAAILVADKEKTAIFAAKLVKIKYTSISNNKPLLSIPDVLSSKEVEKRVNQDIIVEPEDSGKSVDKVIKGEFSIGSQFHFSTETQTCIVTPTEDGMDVYSSTQWLDHVHVAIANSLNILANKVNVKVSRLGGAFGSKISRATQVACAAALVSHLEEKTCRFILPLETNMKVIGKRAPLYSKFEIDVNRNGVIQNLRNAFYSNSGISFNENVPKGTIDHFKHCYESKRWHIEGYSVLTDIPSSTYCRGPRATEGVAMIEYMMEKIAFELKMDPIEVRKANMTDDDNIPFMIDVLKRDSNYDKREEEIKVFNRNNRWMKRSLKCIPLKYGIIYIAPFNAVVSICHADGSVVITHSGIEMGQGLNTKVAQVCAYKLGITLDQISFKPSNTTTSPNCIVTAGAVGSESVVYATMKACEILTQRLESVKKDMAKNSSWADIVHKAFTLNVELQASYFFDNNGQVKPYPVYAVCALEVEVDILTGVHEVKRLDLLEDTGRSLSPQIDVGQIEGSVIMGLGLWTTENIIYDKSNGELLTNRTWSYKIPGVKDIPGDMRIYLRRNGRNEFGVLQSKATGEPAVCVATIIIHALREAVRSARLDAGYDDKWFDIGNPCTLDKIFQAVGHKIEHYKLKD